MVNILLVTHGDIGKEMLQCLQTILKETPNIKAVSVFHNQSPSEIHAKIEKELSSNDTLILTDLFGSTHCNQCLTFLNKGNVEIVSGFNFPILMKLSTMKDELTLSELAIYVKNYGQKNIVSAKEVVKGN
ncbi:MAG: hypothetical protein A3I75_06370 [Deltaproteobacteria bacterium RIFCSPLOWO2_02_FULL_50_16]|nr:MAG: hypothetical protein A2053_05100 [Deltaproteobacteria bacterium GWA2_50_8]OGQ29420.1 MAG: hypothetical protein A3B79_01530 [Deltaproteobacteria bacterium RIFCSPHIGHO2_02_FULL_50_15]OGQ56055.1 MAG: hypothetical protein A3I75_06370 [Deltaproteobacteria bacterium RIFCSPLOWO2_02_FULL_50_16]OGQ68327.1 MAG: hypothetical protein A3F89_04210 [Deltaproteobacteria bacterium RIFCSPLOWO2_12_FULL_50_11]